MIIERGSYGSQVRAAHYELVVNFAIAVLLLVLLAVSLWMIWETSSVALVLAWNGAWCLGAGLVGWYKRSWFWPGICPAVMLALILVWVAVYGRSSWASAFITMLGVMFAVAAVIGAVIGTWLGKRHCV